MIYKGGGTCAKGHKIYFNILRKVLKFHLSDKQNNGLFLMKYMSQDQSIILPNAAHYI